MAKAKPTAGENWLKRQVARNIEGQLPLFQPKVEWEPTPVSQLPSWADAKRVSIDLETHDPELTTLGPGVRRGAKIAGVSFAIEYGPSFYLPVAHLQGGNLDRRHVIDYLREQSRVFEGHIVGANLPYDLDFLWEEKIDFPKTKGYLDIQVAAPLIDEMHDSYSMESIAQRLSMPGKDEKVLREAARDFYVDPKKGLWQLPAKFVAAYACQDVELPLAILRRQEKLIEEFDLANIFALESKLLPVLLKMRRRGVLIDQKRLEHVEQWTIQQQKEACSAIFQLTGVRLSMDDVNSADACAKPLKEIDGIKLNSTPTGKVSIDTAFLESLKHPVATAIVRARKVDKVRNTFAKSVREHMTNGRIHATFNQLRRTADDASGDEKGVRFGRLSCVTPNLQQQPARDPEIGPLWRSVYIPEPGLKWAALDYSGQEPRMTVHYANVTGCEGGKELAEAYHANPDLDLHQMTADIAGIGRKPAKTIFLGLCYGMGGAKLCHGLGLPTQWIHSPHLNKMIEVAGPEGQALLKRYSEMVPFVKQLTKKCSDRAKQKGCIRTILGRVLHFPKKKDGSGDYDWLHKALNRLIQGGAADQTKLAVVEADAAGHELQLQVHDEIDMSVRDEAHAQQVADIMRHCVKLTVPSKVDVEIGDSWGDSM